jgi:site-specific DNA-adenine methylase
MTLATQPPMTYFGAKTKLARRIAALLPRHDHYVEPFGGSLAVLLAKAPSRIETVSDLDGDLMTSGACCGSARRDGPRMRADPAQSR